MMTGYGWLEPWSELFWREFDIARTWPGEPRRGTFRWLQVEVGKGVDEP